MKLILLKQIGFRNLQKGLLGLFLAFVVLLLFACDDLSSTNQSKVPITVIKSSEKELTRLVVSYGGTDYSPDLSSEMTLELPAVRAIGDLSLDPTLFDERANVSTVTTSPKAEYFVSNEGIINLNNPSAVTIEVTAEDGSKKTYTLTTTVSISAGFSIGNTYASNQAILGSGFVDTLMEDTTTVITISKVLQSADFNWKFKDAVNNELVSSTAPKTADADGNIFIFKSDFTTEGKNAIKALINGSNTEVELTVELEYAGNSAETAVQSISYSPYKLFTWHDVQAMRLDLTGDYVLQQEITFPDKGIAGFPTAGFEPIGKDTIDNNANAFDGEKFTGSFDGAGYTLSNFFINRDAYYVGLFGSVSNAGKEIKNFIIKHVGIKGIEYVGAIAGVLDNGDIINVGAVAASATAKIEGTRHEIGGLVGLLNGSKDPSVTDAHVSILTGYVSSDVVGVNNVGGLVGNNKFGVIKGYVTGDVTGDDTVGGLTGSAVGTTVTGYVIGTVTGTNYVGGLIGIGSATTNLNGYNRAHVTRKQPSVQLSFGFLAGNVLDNNNTGIKGYYSGLSTESNFSVGLVNVSGVSGTQIIIDANTAESNFDGFSFSTTETEGDWTFVGSKWPAINIGTIKPALTQPIDP